MKKEMNYNKMLRDFKRHAGSLITHYLPDQSDNAQVILHSALERKHPILHRWYHALLLGLITAEEFVRLFASIKDIFKFKELVISGASAEKIAELSGMITKLFRGMMVCFSETKDPVTPKINSNP